MFILFSLLTFPIVCIAQVTPTVPGPNEIYKIGSECIIKWTPDTTGTWDSFDIDLMSGSNNNMTLVAHVISELDGTSSSSYSWKCPGVQPYSAIYFYQFNQKKASATASHAWTTRFTIASENGTTTSPEHSRQPNGDPIPWGIGHLFVAGVEHSKTQTGTVHLPSNTRHVKAETATPPEVTLNVPPPKPTRNSRRNGFTTVYGGGTHPDQFACRATNTVSAGCRTRFSNKPKVGE